MRTIGAGSPQVGHLLLIHFKFSPFLVRRQDETELWVGTPPGVSGSSLYLMSVSMYPLNTWLYWLT